MSDMYDRQNRLELDTDKNIVVIGCGGIGWHVAKNLAMTGVTKITVFDDDVIEIHNLPRLDVPMTCLGKNKSSLLEKFVKQMRPDANFTGYPFKFNPDLINLDETDIIIDCTDRHDVQLENLKIANDNEIQYVKSGYDGNHITISNTIPLWDVKPERTEGGYTIIPSFICPASIVAALTVNKVLTNSSNEISCNLTDLYIQK